MGIVSDSTQVRIPREAAEHWRDAIRSARAAARALEPWLATQAGPTRQVVGRAVAWWSRCLGVTEPLVVASLTEEP